MKIPRNFAALGSGGKTTGTEVRQCMCSYPPIRSDTIGCAVHCHRGHHQDDDDCLTE